jgi:hypothetical protein
MNVRIKCDMSFGAAVHYDSQFQVNHYSLRLWMTTLHADPATHNVALERIKYFVYNELDSTVFINANDHEQCVRYTNAGMNITTLPTNPVDQIVGIMLFHKLNAIMEQHMIIVETELSSVLGDHIVYLHSEQELTDSVDPAPWWATADLVHCDHSVLGNQQVLPMPHSSVWRDLTLAWPEPAGIEETGNIVVFADFKPGHDTK